MPPSVTHIQHKTKYYATYRAGIALARQVPGSRELAVVPVGARRPRPARRAPAQCVRVPAARAHQDQAQRRAVGAGLTRPVVQARGVGQVQARGALREVHALVVLEARAPAHVLVSGTAPGDRSARLALRVGPARPAAPGLDEPAGPARRGVRARRAVLPQDLVVARRPVACLGRDQVLVLQALASTLGALPVLRAPARHGPVVPGGARGAARGAHGVAPRPACVRLVLADQRAVRAVRAGDEGHVHRGPDPVLERPGGAHDARVVDPHVACHAVPAQMPASAHTHKPHKNKINNTHHGQSGLSCTPLCPFWYQIFATAAALVQATHGSFPVQFL